MKSIAIALGVPQEECWLCQQELPEEYFFWHKEPERKFCSEDCYWLSFEQLEQRSIDPIPAINLVLREWNIPFSEKFLSPDGLVVVALLCNAGAKFFDFGLYDYKPALIEAATRQHCHCWQNDGIVYFETSVGQLSFHVFDGEDELLPSANGREWRGGWMQDEAYGLAMAFLNEDNEVLEYDLQRFLAQEQGW